MGVDGAFGFIWRSMAVRRAVLKIISINQLQPPDRNPPPLNVIVGKLVPPAPTSRRKKKTLKLTL